MSHVSAERLAALLDEPPTPEEVAHLAACPACARERRAYDTLRGLAAIEVSRIGAPLTRWEALAPALRADGVIETGRAPAWRLHRERRWLQVAAALLLVAGGTVLGRLSAHQSALPDDQPAPATATAARPADSAATHRFATAADAQAARDSAAALYQQAVNFLADHDSTSYQADSPAAMRTRLAALDQVGETMREALRQAPSDPVINGYYLTTLGQREATLRQLNTALPRGVRINSF